MECYDTLQTLTSLANTALNTIAQLVDGGSAPYDTTYANTLVPISASQLAYATQLLPLFGDIQPPDISQGISFSAYKFALGCSVDSWRELVTELFETYHAGLNGVLGFELYRDVYDTTQDLLAVTKLFSQSIFKHIDTTTTDTNTLNRLELSAINQLDPTISNSLQAQYELLQNKLHNSLGNGISVSEIQTMRDIAANIDALKYSISTKAECVSVVNAKLVLVGKFLATVQDVLNTADTHIFGTNRNDFKSTITDLMNNAQATYAVCLQLMFDNELAQVQAINTKHRSIVTIHAKLNMLDDIIIGSHLRTHTKPIVAQLNNTFSYSDTIEPLVNKVANGIVILKTKYLDSLTDYYTLDETDYTMRTTKLMVILDKHYTRNYLKLIS